MLMKTLSVTKGLCVCLVILGIRKHPGPWEQTSSITKTILRRTFEIVLILTLETTHFQSIEVYSLPNKLCFTLTTEREPLRTTLPKLSKD
jgi:hypothetical protein